MLAGSVLLGIGFLAFIIQWVGGTKVWNALASLGPIGFLALFVDIALTMTCWLFSWVILLRAYGVQARWPTMVRARLASYAVSYLTPISYSGGEPVGIYILAKETGEPVETLVAAIIVAKTLEGFTLLFFLTVGSLYALFAIQISNELRWSLVGTNLLLGVAMVLAAIDFWRNRLWATRLTRWLGQHLPWKIFEGSAIARVRRVEEEIHYAFQRYRPATAWAAFVSLLGAFFLYLRPQVFFYFSQGMVFSFSQLALIFSLTLVLAAIFWITPGGLGFFEGGLIGIFSLFNISADQAVAFSLSLKPLELVFLALGFASLLRFGTLQFWRTRRASSGQAQALEGPRYGNEGQQPHQPTENQANEGSR